MDFENLSSEMQEKVKACKTPDDVLALAKDEGFELTEDELDQVAGGAWSTSYIVCPECSKGKLVKSSDPKDNGMMVCDVCGYKTMISE